jgi:LacI family transcriptional regulator
MTSQLRSSLVDELADSNIPLVLIGRLVEGQAIPSVAGDDAAGVADAVAHLVALGHTRIAHIGGPQDMSTGRDRYQGYLAGLDANGLESDPSLTAVALGFDEASGAQACRELLGWTRDFTAIIAASDAIAFGCSDALSDAGLMIPRDVSLVGFGGWPSSLRTSPPLTTVVVPYDEIGRIGGRLLLAQLLGEEIDRDVTRVKGQLVVRSTTRRLIGANDVGAI